MYTDNMSYDEIVTEWNRDWKHIIKRLAYEMPKVRRKAVKAKGKIRHNFECTTPYRNFYFVTFVVGKDFFRRPLNCDFDFPVIVCVRERNKGREAISFRWTELDTLYDFFDKADEEKDEQKVQVDHYTAHFFARFAERYGCDKKGLDLIKAYFSLDNSSCSGIKNRVDDRLTVFNNVGILLGRFIDKEYRHIIFYTFGTIP